jgi:hypothetical protein
VQHLSQNLVPARDGTAQCLAPGKGRADSEGAQGLVDGNPPLPQAEVTGYSGQEPRPAARGGMITVPPRVSMRTK